MMRSWAGDQGKDCTGDWEEFAREQRVARPDGRSRWLPSYAWTGEHRWVACVREAGREHHLYAGVRVTDDVLPEPRAVAEKATDLFDRIDGMTIKRDGRKVKVNVAGQLHVRGAESGRFLCAKRLWHEVARDRKTLGEGTALAVAALGAGISTNSFTTLAAAGRSLGIVAVVLVIAYGILTTIKWLETEPEQRWEAREWPK